MPVARARFRYLPLLWAAVVVMVLLTAVLAAFMAGPAGTRYRRIVSRPLPGGSRYTFLYPAHLQDIQENGKGASPEAIANVDVWTMNQTESVWIAFLRWLGVSPPSPAERIIVVVIPLKSRNVRDRRRSEIWSRFGDMRHNEYIEDARTRTRFILLHCGRTRDAAQFRAHDPVIARSFQVLPPDAALPTR